MKNSPAQLIKKLAGTFALFALAANARAQFTFPVYEPFAYFEGDRLGTNNGGGSAYSGTNWTFGNSVSLSSSAVASTTNALSYPGLFADTSVPARGELAATGVGRTRAALMTPQTSGTVYASFLFNLLNPPTAPRYFFGLNTNTTGTPSASVGTAVWVNQLGQLQVSKTSATTPATNLTYSVGLGDTHLVVIAYKFGVNPNEVDLWLDPVNLGNNSIIPMPTITTTNNANATNLSSICLYAASGQSAMTNLFDELRVDNNWAGVTKASASPGNIYGVTGGGSGCPGTAFAVGLNGSDHNVNYLVYTNGVYNGQTVAGTGSSLTLAMETSTALYSVLASNTLNANVGWMSNTVSLTVLAGPVITTQPASVLVATNGLATFNVVATGQGLNYKWYKNSAPLADGGHVSGSSTPTLSISPATSADAATTANGYFVIITNSCGLAATSSVVALTLDSPANLYWIGNNPNSNWDVATTANFSTSSGGTPTSVFNAGDNVTFDDSASTFVVTVTGNVTPTLMTENAGGTYTINGAGSITGPGALVMNGGGILSFQNANSFTGGTTLNSGYVEVSNASYQCLGSGPITFAGGELITELSAASGIGLSNNLIVTTGGTYDYNGTGSYGTALFGTMTGTAGATLTITHLQAGPDRFRIFNTNFTMNANINLNGSGLLFAPYNGSGTQTYNGMISGSGALITRQDGGTIILNGANTYSGGTELTSGLTGLGIDATGGSGPLGTGGIGLSEDGAASGSASANATLFASGGAHTLNNPIVYSNAIEPFTFIMGGSNSLTLSGTIDLHGQLDGAGGVNRTMQIDNTNTLTTFSGVISDSGLTCGLVKNGNGNLSLATVNTYDGPTVVSNGTLFVDGQIDTNTVAVYGGTLGGVGTILGAVTVATNGAIDPGDVGIGTLTITKTLTLQAGSTTSVEVNSTGACDLLTGLSGITYGGTLNASNLSGTLSVGQTFHIVNAAAHSGNFSAITGSPGSGKMWTFNPTNGVLSVVTGVNSNPTNIIFSATGTSVSLSWPADHLGWTLEVQTNPLSVGLSTNWTRIAGTSNVVSTNFPLSLTAGTVFYRLIYP